MPDKVRGAPSATTARSATPLPALGATVLPGVAMIAVTFGLARYGYGLLLPDMQAELVLSPSIAGLISSGTYLSYLVANVVVVPLTSRWGPRTAIAAAAALAAFGMSMIATAKVAPMLAAGVLIGGAAAGLAFPPYADVVATQVRATRRDLAWSAISSGTGWGVALAGPVAIAAGHRWRLVWMLFVAVTVAVGVVAVLRAPRRGGLRARRPQLSWTWFFCPKSRPLLVSAVLVGAGSSVWWSFSVDALRSAGMGPAPARMAYAVCGAASILASFTGTVVNRIGLRAGYFVACLAVASSLVLLGMGARYLVAAFVAAVGFGIFYGALIAVQGVWSSRVFADHPSAGQAALNVALTIGTLVGPITAGAAIHAVGYGMTFLGAGLAVVVALPFCPPTRRRRAKLAAHQCSATPVRE